MDFKLGTTGEVTLIPVFNDTESVDTANELYRYLKDKDIFKGDVGETYANLLPTDGKILFLGLGNRDKLNTNALRKSFFNAGRELMKFKIESVNLHIIGLLNICGIAEIQAMVEGLLQSEYSFEKYMSEKKIIPSIKDVSINLINLKEQEMLKAVNEIKTIIEGVFLARDLVNEPAMTMTPAILANNAKNELENIGVKVEIYDKQKIQELGMKAFLAVSEGSSHEPKLIIMNYMGDPNSDKKIALVGKGLTFDSGGYCIKPPKGMDTMFTDMAGAASVIGAMKAIAKSRLNKNVIAIVAACENLISGGAYKPGDIIQSMSGKTIEVLNTDAEGRLTLADALWFAAKKLKANIIIDIATLTGACVVALGNINTGAITNNDDLMALVKSASTIAGEPVWEFPHNEEYREFIKGNFADLKNTGDKGAGTITAGLFLEEFVDNTPWVHLDIAGTSYDTEPSGYLPKGATGVPVKTLYHLVKSLES